MTDRNSFTDKVRITIKAGDGGDGMNSFKAFKGKPACGPDGGDGGKGGDVYILADRGLGDLLSFRYTSKYVAGNGERGGTNLCSGKGGEDVIIKVPVGTVVKDYETGTVIADMFSDGEKKLIAEGGRGGKGNTRFTTARRHAPNFAQKGEKTDIHTLVLELKVIADVGIIGFPNVGKSTLLSKISAARPKVANYHFTTLSPNLGVVKYYDNSFVAADIPGLIEGASSGAGLGHDFLRHIERTRMLLHVVDISGVEGRDPIEDFVKINAELAGYSQKLASLPQVIALNKCDIFGAEENIKAFKKKYGKKYKIFTISAINAGGTEELVKALFEMLQTLPPVAREEVDELFTYRKSGNLEFEIYMDGDAYVVVGTLVDMLCRNVSLDDPESMAYFQKILREKGVISRLEAMGAKEKDTVVVGDVEFDFIP
ncbi:MAG: GTPase ObgE [Clostridia bacterium]|nr:GTPase ObgE [Clostridia bacterium]